MVWASVCLSVCLSHSAASQNGTKGSRNLHCELPQGLLIFRDKISCHWVRGFLSNEGVKEGYSPLKRRYFAAIGLFSVKTVADRYRHAAYHDKHWWQALYLIYQHRWPWTTLNSQKRCFSKFLAAAHISEVNCVEMPENRRRQFAYVEES